MQPARSRSLALSALVATLLLAGRPAGAGDVDFDDLAPGNPWMVGTLANLASDFTPLDGPPSAAFPSRPRRRGWS